MSCTWNGHVMPDRADTPAGRCLAILEHGMAQMGLASVPQQFNRIMAAPVEPMRVAGVRQSRVYHRIRHRGGVAPSTIMRHERAAKILAAWHAMPAELRSSVEVARRLSLSPKVAYTVLSAAGLTQQRGNYRPPMRAGEVAAMLESWRQLPADERIVSHHAKRHGMSAAWAWKKLFAAGLLENKRKAVA